MFSKRKQSLKPADASHALPPLNHAEPLPMLSQKALYKLGAEITVLSPPSPLSPKTTSDERLNDNASSICDTPRSSMNYARKSDMSQTSGLFGKLKRKASARLQDAHPGYSSPGSSTLSVVRPSASSTQSGRLSSEDSLLPRTDRTSSTSSLGSPPHSADHSKQSFLFDQNYSLSPTSSLGEMPRRKSLSRSNSGVPSSSSSKTYKMQMPEITASPIQSVGSEGEDSAMTPIMKTAESPQKASKRAIPKEGQSTTEDATEEIVPWMFDQQEVSSSSRTGSPLKNGRPRFVSQFSSASLDHKLTTLRNTKSFANMRQHSANNSVDDFSSIVSGQKSQSAGKGFFDKLRKKASRHETFRDPDTGSPFLLARETFDSAPIPKSPSLASVTSNNRKVSAPTKMKGLSKMKKSRTADKLDEQKPVLTNGMSEAQALAAASTGVTLDTNMDEMEGIVSAEALSAPNGYLSDVTFPSSQPHPRPDTPDNSNASALYPRRRPSVAASLLGGTIESNVDTPGDSPMSSRSIMSSRRPSAVPDSIWNPSFIRRNSATSIPPVNGIGITMGSISNTFAPLDDEQAQRTPVRGKDHKGSLGFQAAAAANAAAKAALAAKASAPVQNSIEAGWTAPESWAVEDTLEDALAADRSDDDGEAIDSPSQPGSAAPQSSILEDVRRESVFKSGSEGRPSSASKRPGTGSNSLTTGSKGSMFSIRVFKPDGSHTTLVTPFAQTVAEITYSVARKPGFVQGKGFHKLFILERGLERALGLNERPIRIQQLRLEQAGYTEWDKPEDLGRQDHSYLIKFVFKPDVALRSASEDFNIDTFEYVDLRARALTTIPIFLYNHAHNIVSLNLSKNPKLDLPADFVQLCTSLRELRIADNAIKRIPQSTRQAVALTRLDISSNRILDLDHIRLDDMKELILLEAYDNRLSTLPDYFGRFSMLKYLNMSNNKIDVFPSIICQIFSLVDLDLSFNALAAIPGEISNLKSLERLHIVGNVITALPASFEQLIKLQDFDCRQNSIENFSILSQVPNLISLRCDYNRCSVLDLFSPTLKTFSFSYNPITQFHITGCGSSLTHLNIAHGKLITLDPECFKHFGSLETFIFDNNVIRELPESLGLLSNLVRLSGRGNKLETLPESISKLARLQYMNVANNNLATLPTTIWYLPELIYFNASSNLLEEFPDPPTFDPNGGEADGDTQDRKMSAASKISTARGGSPLAAALQELYLADNRLPDETFHPVSLMTDLRILNLSWNELYEIPHKALSKSVQLEELYLSGNKLMTLPEDDFEKLINLKTVHLNGNKLNTLPAELGTLKKLQVLDVGSNILKYNIANWKYDWNWNWNLELRYLNLSGNKRLEIKPAGISAVQTAAESSPTAKRRNLSDFSSLRKVRTLGLMDVTLMIPSVPDDNEERRVRTTGSEVNEMGYGIADTLGAVDNLTIIDLVLPKFRNKDDECLLGIFDSQLQSNTGGARLAKYLQDCFAPNLNAELNKMVEGESDVTDVLRRTFLNLNRDYGNIVLSSDYERSNHRRHRRREGDRFGTQTSADSRTGASGVVAYISEKTLYVANVGRALAVVANRSGRAQPLTVKHEPLAREEWSRIRSSEGWVSNKGYVNDEVDVSRSFGHYHVFPSLNASPSIQVHDLSNGDEFIILANRSLWDFIDYQTAVDIAWSERADAMMAAQKLRDFAIAYGSTSHIMVMVVSLADMFKTKKSVQRRGGMSAKGDDEDSYFSKSAIGGRGKGIAQAPTDRFLTMMDREIAPPVGMLALCFTDIRNSTSLWDSNPGMHVAMRMHNQLLRRQLRAIGGYEVKTEGDAFMCSFPSVTSAVLWAFTCQLELLKEDWPLSILDCEDGMEIFDADSQELIYRGLSVRMGIHLGQPHCETDPITRRMDYFGPVVNRCARVSALAEGGQISCSADVVEIIKALCLKAEGEDVDDEELEELDEVTQRDIVGLRNLGVVISELGERRLKGLETSEFISLLYPKALAGRLRYTTANEGRPATSSGRAEVTPSFEPVQQILDVAEIQSLGTLCARLEAAVSAEQPGSAYATWLESSPSLSTTPGSPTLSLTRRRKPPIRPCLIVPMATDEELFRMLEEFVCRVENATNTLVIKDLGAYTEVLSALSEVVKVDPRSLFAALSMFAGVMNT